MKLRHLFSNKLPSSRAILFVGLFGPLLGAACDSAGPGETQGAAAEPVGSTQGTTYDIDIHRSLAIVDLATLGAMDGHGRERFSLRRVLGKIATTSRSTQGVSALELYRRLWDTNNDKAHGYFPDGQHCDDEKDAYGHAMLGGSPLECPRQEGVLADPQAHNPFCSDASCDPYSPIAIVNRFDLAPENGQTCGQYRIVYGKGTAGVTPVEMAGNPDPFNRNLMIFEAILPNPHPGQGLAGCAPVVSYWAALSAEDDHDKRAEALDRFFFDGVLGFPAAFDFDHFTGAVDPETEVQLSGQIRANQFMFFVHGDPWQLREYNLARECHGPRYHRVCSAKVKLVSPKINPDASLFDDANQSPRALAFRDPNNPRGLFGQLDTLSSPDLNLINMNGLGPEFNGAQSTSSPLFILDPTLPPPPGTQVFDDTNYLVKIKLGGAFIAKLQSTLVARGSKLGAVHIVRRAQTQSCAGCHELSTTTAAFFGGKNEANRVAPDLLWPDAALGAIPLPAFTQTSEALLVPLDPYETCDVACTADPTHCRCAWALSQALNEVFLPFRKENMKNYLSQVYTGQSAWVDDDWGPAHKRVRGSSDN
jgi:hypothetical protein